MLINAKAGHLLTGRLRRMQINTCIRETLSGLCKNSAHLSSALTLHDQVVHIHRVQGLSSGDKTRRRTEIRSSARCSAPQTPVQDSFVGLLHDVKTHRTTPWAPHTSAGKSSPMRRGGHHPGR